MGHQQQDPNLRDDENDPTDRKSVTARLVDKGEITGAPIMFKALLVLRIERLMGDRDGQRGIAKLFGRKSRWTERHSGVQVYAAT